MQKKIGVALFVIVLFIVIPFATQFYFKYHHTYKTVDAIPLPDNRDDEAIKLFKDYQFGELEKGFFERHPEFIIKYYADSVIKPFSITFNDTLEICGITIVDLLPEFVGGRLIKLIFTIPSASDVIDFATLLEKKYGKPNKYNEFGSSDWVVSGGWRLTYRNTVYRDHIYKTLINNVELDIEAAEKLNDAKEIAQRKEYMKKFENCSL